MEQTYLDRLLRLKNNFSVKIILGVAGAGKSTLLKNFAETLQSRGVASTEIIFIDCAADDRSINFQQLYNLVEERSAGLEKFFLLVDDIDRVADSEKTVNALFVGAPAEIYVTASGNLLAEKISALLPKNCDVLKLFPPSFAEYAKNFPAESPADVLQRYLHFGSMPATIGADENFLPTILRGLAYEIMFDATAKNSLRNAERARLTLKRLAQIVGQSTNNFRLLNFLRNFDCATNIPLFKTYLDGISDFFVRIPRINVKTGAPVVNAEKFYFVDNGLLRALRNFDAIDETTLIENAVCIELLRRGFDVSYGKFGKMPVDFVATRGNEKILLQVLPPDGSISARKITRPLRADPDATERILISTTPQKNLGDVKNIPLQEFLSNS